MPRSTRLPRPRPGVRVAALAVTAALTLGSAGSAGAQGALPWSTAAAAPIGLGDPVYDTVDELLSLVPVPGAIVGQRPWSRPEITRIVRAADRELLRRDSVRSARREARIARTPGIYVPDAPSSGEVRAAALVGILRDAYEAPSSGEPSAGGEPQGEPRSALAVTGRPIDALSLGAWGTRAPARRIPSNGLGDLDAVTLPPLDGRGGRPTVQGGTWNVETLHTVGIGDHVALVAQPRFSYVVPYGASQRVNVEPQRLFARVTLANLALQAGLDEWQWGQGGTRSLALSGHARPLRALSVASDTAFALPWKLAALGRWRAMAFVADLGAAQNFPHAKLAGYKIGVTPIARLELGGGVMSQFGGRGAPRLTTGQRAADLFPFVTWLNEGSDRQASNKLGMLEARLRIPEARGLTLAWEVALEDFDHRRARSMLTDDAGHLVALSIPRLRTDGTLGLDVQAQRTGLRMYQHGQFTSGLTYRDQVLGTPLGANARALYATLAWRPTLVDALALELAAEERDGSQWTSGPRGGPDGPLEFFEVAPGIDERRQRAALAWRRQALGAGTVVRARGGAEVVRDENFAATPRRIYAFGELTLQLRF